MTSAARLAVALMAAAALVTGCSSSSGDGASRPRGSTPAAVAPAPASATDEGTRTRVTSDGGGLELETLSTRASMVSGGDVLVALSGRASEDAVVDLNGEQVTEAFSPAGDARRALLTQLKEGENRVTARAGGDAVTLAVVNHSENGPIFSGPHLSPWSCTTVAAGLGPPTDADCDAPVRTTWSYVSTGGQVKPLADPASAPPDLAKTKVNDTDIPFVIRTEQGVIDRGIYTIWVLDAAPATEGDWDRRGWNERLVYRFGGGCGTQYAQGSSFVGGADASLLGQGYAIATNTLDTFQTACNPVLSAEAALMTREHFVEKFGLPRFTIGDGGSGGAIQQLALAYNYPGILDAVSASVPFPDAVSIAAGVTDCGLLVHYYSTDAGTALSDAQRAAINGHASTGTCDMWNRLFVGGVNPTDGCDAIGSAAYDPVKNPKGARCTLQDSNVNVLGIDPNTGFARRPLDNTGVQYGLTAVNTGIISIDQFLDLNERIGGYDIDGNIGAAREQMDDETAGIAFRTGGVVEGGPLRDIPILLRNLYTDTIGDIHTRFHVFSIRERLQRDGADDPNLVVWTGPAGNIAQSLTGNVAGGTDAIELLDDWLTSGHRPDDATNRCQLPDGTVVRGGWELYDQPGPCTAAYPVHGDPRIAAGGPPRGDVIKCALVPVDPASYSVALSAPQVTRLQQIFPNGVCDWTKTSAGAQPTAGTWANYSR